MNKQSLIILIVAIALMAVVGYLVLVKKLEVPGTTPMPTISESATPTVSVATEPNIRVSSPQPNDAIGLPLVITGQARVFESQFNYRLRDADGSILIEGMALAHASDSGQFGNFTVSTSYAQPTGDHGTLEVFDYSARDGAQIDTVTIPVTFKPVVSMTVKIYLSSRSSSDPNNTVCDKTTPVDRRIVKTLAPARATLEELLQGPTSAETDNGLISLINPGVVINKLTISKAVAYVDFGQTLQAGVAGACRVSAIKAEIVDTLKQFATIKSVVISINGETQGILQP